MRVSFLVGATQAPPAPAPSRPAPTPVRALGVPCEVLGADAKVGDVRPGSHSELNSTELEEDENSREGDEDEEPPLDIPKLGDKSVESPRAGEPDLSRSAIDSRLRRVFKPNLKGKMKVSDAILKDWECGAKSKQRKQLEQIFAMCGYCPDTTTAIDYFSRVQSLLCVATALILLLQLTIFDVFNPCYVWLLP